MTESIHSLISSSKKILCNPTSTEFWSIMDLLQEDQASNKVGKGFYNNRDYILEQYTKENMYIIRIEETDELYVSSHFNDENVFLKGSFYGIPGFCIYVNNKIEILWVEKNNRLNGYGRFFVEELNRINNGNVDKYGIEIALKKSVPFWNKLGVKFERVSD